MNQNAGSQYVQRNWRQTLHAYRKCLLVGDIAPMLLAFPVFLGLIAAVFEGASLALLVPLLDGLLFNSFEAVEKIDSYLPESVPRLQSLPPDTCIMVLLSMLLLANLIKLASGYYGQLSVTGLARTLQVRLRQDLFKKYLQFGKLFIDAKNSGYFYHILMHDTDQIGGVLYRLQGVFQSVAMISVYAFLMLSISWQLTALVVLLFPVLFLSLRKIFLATQDLSARQSHTCLELARDLQNAMNNVPLIKASATEALEERRFTEKTDRVENLRLQIDGRNLLLPPVQEMVTLLFLLCIVFYIYFVFLPDNGSAASAAVFLILLRRVSIQTSAISAFWQNIAGISGPIANIEEFLSPDGKQQLPDGAVEKTSLDAGIKFQNVSFRYLNGKQALRHVSFTIPRGAHVALVGETGAGKSTCMQLVLRFYDPSEGTIMIDGIPLSDLKIAAWRRLISYVSQEVVLFNDTIQANLEYGLTARPSQQQLEQAIEVAQLSEFIKQLPQGLLSTIGDRGVRLSGGERQRIAIARAYLKNSPVLLFDEPTSALDSQTEERIQRAMKEIKKNRTVLTIAHRLSTIENADYIVVLDRGTVAEAGTREELIQAKGLFHSTWSRQSGEKSQNT